MYKFNFNAQQFSAMLNTGSGANGGREISESFLEMDSHNKSYQGFDIGVPIDSKVVAISLQPQDLDNVNEDFVEQHVGVVVKVTHEGTIDDKKNLTKPSSERQLEQFISNLLKYGVLLSSAIVLVGGFLYLMGHGAEVADYRFFQGEPSELRSPSGVVKAVLSGSHRAIIQLGLLILIATPMARVAFSFLAFLRQRDFTYVIVTLLVLAALIYSIIGAYT